MYTFHAHFAKYPEFSHFQRKISRYMHSNNHNLTKHCISISNILVHNSLLSKQQKTKYTLCVIITGTPKFKGQNLVNMQLICTKNFCAKTRDNAAWSVTRNIHHMYCLYRVTSLLMWCHCELDQHVIDTAVRQWRTPLRMSRRKANTLKIWTQTYPVVLAHCLYRTQLFVLSEWLQRLPAFIVDFRGCLCDRVDFCPAVLYTVCAASHLKDVVVNLASPDVS